MKLKELLDRQDDMMWFRMEGAPHLGNLWSADYLNGDGETMRALAPYLGCDVVNFWPETFEDPDTGRDVPILAVYTDACVVPGPRCSCCGASAGGGFADQEDAERAASDAAWVCVAPMYLCPKCQDDISNGAVEAAFARKGVTHG